MSKDPMYDITMAAADLKVSVPDQFGRLVSAFRALEEKYQREFIAADPKVIFGAQGRAWLAMQLRARMEFCLEQKNEIETRK